MTFTEYETTRQNVERARQAPELEKYIETESKLIPLNPEVFDAFKSEAIPIEQIYLSKPSDEFSLRVRCEYGPEGPKYSSTQKDRGETDRGALCRREVNTPITPEAYAQYEAMDFPRVRKLRATILEGVTVDFYDDAQAPVIVEVEHGDAKQREQLQAYLEKLTGATLIDSSGDADYTNEAIAYRQSSLEYNTVSPESLDAFAEKVVGEMVARYATGKKLVVAGLTGMSGSGKTTVTNAVQERIVEHFGESYRPVVLSTDDYHFGRSALEAKYGAPYTTWDHGRTYNTEKLAEDLRHFAEGEPLTTYHFDFETEEPVTNSEAPTEFRPFVVVEGLYAGSKDLEAVRDVHFTLPTGIATSVGRDVRRLVIDGRANRVFPTPESRLRYQIETAIPLYLQQEAPERKPFSASSRVLGERAFMLARLREK